MTVTDTAGNPAEVSIAFPMVDKGDQTLFDFAYTPVSVTIRDSAPTVTPPTGAEGTLTYSAAPASRCTVDAANGALTWLGSAGTCTITATAGGTDDYNATSVDFRVTLESEGRIELSLDNIATDEMDLVRNTVDIAEKAAGFTISGTTRFSPPGSVGAIPFDEQMVLADASVTVTVGGMKLSATSDAGGAWSVSVPSGAAYITHPGVTVRVSASKFGYSTSSSGLRLTVDLIPPSVSYPAAPDTLTVGIAIADLEPSTDDLDLRSYRVTTEGAPQGLRIDSVTGVISVTPEIANPTSTTFTVTVTDYAGNPTGVLVTFPPVAKGEVTILSRGAVPGFSYDPATVPFGDPAPTHADPYAVAGIDRGDDGFGVPISFSAAPADVCTVDDTSGVLMLVGVGTCTITATAEGTDNYNDATATATVKVLPGTLALNLDPIATDDTVNIDEHATGFTISGDTGSEPDVMVRVTIGSQSSLTATLGTGGVWSVIVPAGASYLTGTSVTVTVSASKTNFTSPTDVDPHS